MATLETIPEVTTTKGRALRLLSEQIKRPSQLIHFGRGLIAGVSEVTDFTFRQSSKARQSDWY